MQIFIWVYLFACFHKLSWFYSDGDFNPYLIWDYTVFKIVPSQYKRPWALGVCPHSTTHMSPGIQCSVRWFPRLHHWQWRVAWCSLLSSSNQAPATTILEPWSGFWSTRQFQQEAIWRNSASFECKMCSCEDKMCFLWIPGNTSFSNMNPPGRGCPRTSTKWPMYTWFSDQSGAYREELPSLGAGCAGL